MKPIFITFLFMLFFHTMLFAQNTNNNDTLLNNKNSLQNQQTELTQQIQTEFKYKTEIETQRLYKTIFLIGFIFIALILMFITYFYKTKMTEAIKLMEKQNFELLVKNSENKRLSVIINHSENAISIIDLSGEIKWLNKGYTGLFGLTLDDLKEKKLNNLFQSSSVKNKAQIIKCIEEKEPVVYSDEFTDDFDNKIWYQRCLLPVLNDKQEIECFAAIDNDLTALNMAMEQINIQKKHAEEQRNIAIKQREEITRQKQKITDSINYASYIQAAVLTPYDILNDILPEFFILYKPRDIVSGDFYWATQLNDQFFIAAADCTGHGVPGAFMSMLGISFLNEIVKDEELTAAEVLNRLRDNVMKSLHQTGKENESKDGMDISLCVLNKKIQKLQFAGANNPLYLIRNPKENPELNEIKADKMPIGIHSKKELSFTNHIIDIQPGDSFYLLSDGYEDQFGGEKGRKFLSKNFKELLIKISNQDMNKQKLILDETIEHWKSFKNVHNEPYEQVDDILVMGVRV